MGARLPQECVALTAHDFATMIYHTTHRVPSYQRWLDTTDLRWVYASHRRQLQYLQWKVPARALGAEVARATCGRSTRSLAVYPDARIVQTHRDPLKVVASLASLVTVLRSLARDTIDPHEIGARVDAAPRARASSARWTCARRGTLPRVAASSTCTSASSCATRSRWCGASTRTSA